MLSSIRYSWIHIFFQEYLLLLLTWSSIYAANAIDWRIQKGFYDFLFIKPVHFKKSSRNNA